MQPAHVPGSTEIRGWVIGFDCPPGEVRVRYVLRDDPFIWDNQISTFQATHDRCVSNPRGFVLTVNDAVRVEVTEDRKWNVHSRETRP